MPELTTVTMIAAEATGMELAIERFEMIGPTTAGRGRTGMGTGIAAGTTETEEKIGIGEMTGIDGTRGIGLIGTETTIGASAVAGGAMTTGTDGSGVPVQDMLHRCS